MASTSFVQVATCGTTPIPNSWPVFSCGNATASKGIRSGWDKSFAVVKPRRGLGSRSCAVFCGESSTKFAVAGQPAQWYSRQQQVAVNVTCASATPKDIITYSVRFGAEKRDALKRQLLDTVLPLAAGAAVQSPAQLAEIEALTQQLEALNPTPAPTSSPDISGNWRLVFTTSESILGLSRPKFLRPQYDSIYQLITAAELSVQNTEVIKPLPSVVVKNQVRATFTVDSPSKVSVKFIEFQIGPLKIPAGENARGFLETTYLDSTLRISRGNKDNLFILIK